MGKPVKVALYSISTVVVIMLIAVITLPFLIDPNDFKPEIEQAVKNKTGRELTIDGNIELSIFPWLGFATEKVVLSNAPGFPDKPFAEINGSQIKVKLVPLLSKKIEVDRIILKGLILNLAQTSKGTNWDDLSSLNKTGKEAQPGPSGETEQTGATPLAVLAIAGITIENAQIDWDDLKNKKHLIISDLNLNTDDLSFSQPIDINLGFTLHNPETQLTEKIKLSTELNINEKLDQIKLDQLNIQSTTQSQSLPGGELKSQLSAQALIDLTGDLVQISNLKVSADALNISGNITGSGIQKNPVFKGAMKIEKFNPKVLMQHWQIDIPKMQDPSALTAAAADFDILATSKSINLQNVNLQLDESRLDGSVGIKDFEHQNIDFKLHIDHINADRYLPPESVDDKSKPIASPAAAAAAGASLFPAETLRTLNVNGLVTIDTMQMNHMNMQGVNLKLTAKNGALNTSQAIKSFYQGSYSGKSQLNVRNDTSTLTLDERISQVQIEPLLQAMKKEAKISGLMTAHFKLTSHGNTESALKTNLKGDLDFLFKNSVIKGFNLQQIIDNAKTIIKGTPLSTDNPADQTAFSEIKATAQISNGVISNNDLLATSSKLNVSGAGTADLKSEQLNYKVTAKIIKTPATETTQEKLQGVPIIINIGGTLTQPSYTLDVANMLLEENKEKIEEKKQELLDKLDKKLEKKLGPGGASELLKRFF